jgi:hypothetical protein
MLLRYSRDEVIAFFAQHEGMHPNGPVAVMCAVDYYRVEPIVIKGGSGKRYEVNYVDDYESEAVATAAYTIRELADERHVL